MPTPKKHAKRPANAKAKKQAGWSRTIGLTLSDDTLLHLEAIGAHHGLSNRSAVVRWLAKQEADRIILAVTKTLK